jgi:hypothetical protein
VLSLRRRHAPALDEVVRDLPEGYVTLAFGDARLVVGPPGAFALVDAADTDVCDAARLVAATARELRHRLAGALSWAPFIDALVVVDGLRDVARLTGDGTGSWAGAGDWPRGRVADVAGTPTPDGAGGRAAAAYGAPDAAGYGAPDAAGYGAAGPPLREAALVPRRIVRSVITAGRPRFDAADIARICAALT